MTRQEQFFYDNAGYSFNPATETPEQGKRRCAAELAKAEQDALNEGWRCRWGRDDDGEYCEMWTSGGTWLLESLSGIEDPTPEYRRVVEAELALQAAGTVTRYDREDVDSREWMAGYRHMPSGAPVGDRMGGA